MPLRFDAPETVCAPHDRPGRDCQRRGRAGLARRHHVVPGRLGYDTAGRTALSPEAVGLSGEPAGALRKIELLSEDPEQFLCVAFARPKSLTAKVRNDLVRVLGRSTIDHLLVLASDFDTLEFVLLDKPKRELKGPGGGERRQVVPKTISINRRSPTRLDLRTLR